MRQIDEGDSYPLGAAWTGSGVNFALFSAHATKVELCFFDKNGRSETARFPLPCCTTNQIWHGFVADARPGQLYGYRVHGPYEPEHGHRFNHHKLVLDPYARQIVRTHPLARRVARVPPTAARGATRRPTVATARR